MNKNVDIPTTEQKYQILGSWKLKFFDPNWYKDHNNACLKVNVWPLIHCGKVHK